jgi:class 3 adenylate cyclase
MAETRALWELLRGAASPQVAEALEREVAVAPDKDLARVNALAFAARTGLGEDDVIGTLVHAARLGLFDMAWNVLCPGCGGVLETAAALKTLSRDEFYCTLCAADYVPTLDEVVEASFTVNARVRRIAAHDPDTLPHTEYQRQVFWGTGMDLPDDLDSFFEKICLDAVELAPGEKATLSLVLPAAFAIVFDPVTHTAVFLDVAGEPTSERRSLSLVLNDTHSAAAKHELRPGPVRVAIENRSARRTLPGVWLHNEDMDALFSRRRPFLTAKRLLSNQAFRDLYRSGTFDAQQRFKITSLTVLFTDLRGSTALYDRVGDLAAFDLVRSHFGEVIAAVAGEGGAVVKTIGDAVMATFPMADRALSSAMRMREAMRKINDSRGSEDLALNIGLHEGPCLAVMLDDRQDYFGQTVNIASRVQGLAEPAAVLATKPVVESAGVARLVADHGYRMTPKRLSLHGVSEAFEVFEISERESYATGK